MRELLDPGNRIVTHLPLESLWDSSGALSARKGRAIAADDIRGMLRGKQRLRFAVANSGAPLLWIAPTDCLDFWKTQVQSHLHDPAKPHVEDYPNEYFYYAYEWYLAEGETVIVLEKIH